MSYDKAKRKSMGRTGRKFYLYSMYNTKLLTSQRRKQFKLSATTQHVDEETKLHRVDQSH
jgi:hypothetical protein